MRATTLVKFDATHQVKYNPPLTRAVHFTAKQFHNNRRLLFHSPQGKFHWKKVFVKNDKDLFSVYDSDWNFSYHPEPEESRHVMVTDFALEISLPSH